MRKLVLLALCALLAVGCADQPGDPLDDGEEVDAQTLQQRPSMEEVTARYEQMQQKLRDRLSADLGLTTAWVDDGESGSSGCKEAPDVPGAEKHSLNIWTYHGNIPDSQWPQAQRIATEVAGEYGFGAPEVILDRPGEHNIVLHDSFGADLDFATSTNTIMRVHTGCHLLQSAKG
ncbi:hypothetical protein GCM10011581_04640 [Saccharopolyspora subtropica]|uniref:LppA-like lipoprotein n=1 Tax=Saccharopolyspora thermophila TaxID=89367 RepID=A0A917N8J4_9PSEU|nr:LppA family lipoprotein [Saccharopolyspora subtropica]GGI70708.1 hypothetical protein GCM10011581_04640 [Saccharopolyspora subtropica]